MQQDYQGVDLRPYWRLVPSWAETDTLQQPGQACVVRIKPGAGFGDGQHETTQLCLLALGYFIRQGFRPSNVLDFGTGSGVLAVCAARFGARVEAIDIDPASLQNARENAKLNAVESNINLIEKMSRPAKSFDLVVANIICPVLMDHGEELCKRQSPRGKMILSGLVSTDVPIVLARFNPLLAPMRPEVFRRGVWRAIVYG